MVGWIRAVEMEKEHFLFILREQKEKAGKATALRVFLFLVETLWTSASKKIEFCNYEKAKMERMETHTLKSDEWVRLLVRLHKGNEFIY